MENHPEETNGGRKETSGLWAILVFAVMMGGVIALAVLSAS